MTKTRSHKLKNVQKTILNQKILKLDGKLVKRAIGVTVRLDKINFTDFDRKRVAHCSIQLDRKKFKWEGESKAKIDQ